MLPKKVISQRLSGTQNTNKATSLKTMLTMTSSRRRQHRRACFHLQAAVGGGRRTARQRSRRSAGIRRRRRRRPLRLFEVSVHRVQLPVRLRIERNVRSEVLVVSVHSGHR